MKTDFRKMISDLRAHKLDTHGSHLFFNRTLSGIMFQRVITRVGHAGRCKLATFDESDIYTSTIIRSPSENH